MKMIKNMISKAKNAVNNAAVKASTFLMVQKNKMRLAVANNRGDNYVSEAVKILIAIVLGGLLLAGLYALFGDVVMPTLKTKIQEMFNYKG
ncbi:DUF6133 family protein [Oscillibacter ruminantium]|uniref:DUF6133 family protein n=1 Tax=Oscillibacter ruminantium TaxID=1263547 RepID=UPI003324A095